MTDTSERDRLVEALADDLHEQLADGIFFVDMGDGISWHQLDGVKITDLADVLLAAGWSRVVPRPDVEAEVEWGVRSDLSGKFTVEPNEEAARASARGDFMTALFRTVGPWQEAL